MSRKCAYCDEPMTCAGINYGGEVMHAACYVKFNDEMEAAYPDMLPPIDFDLAPELVITAFERLREVDDEDWAAFLQLVTGNESCYN